jgi:hypothetical protein
MENEKPILRGELALMAAIVINSFSTDAVFRFWNFGNLKCTLCIFRGI